MEELVYIGLGSNIGDPFATLLECCRKLRKILENLSVSSLWETEPLIVEDQPRFLNMVVSGSFAGSPLELVEQLWKMENEAGRNRSLERPKGPRPLDLDILLFGSQVVANDTLTIPHPGMTERAFVLVPLIELNQSLTDPVSRHPYKSFLESIDDQGFICYKQRDEMTGLLGREEKRDGHGG